MQYMALIACKLFNSHTHSALSISFQTLYLCDQNQVYNWNAAFIISYVIHVAANSFGTWTLNMLWFMKLLQICFFFNLVFVSLNNNIFSYEVPPISSLMTPPDIFLSCFYQIFTRSAVWPRHRLVGTLLPHLGKKYNFNRKKYIILTGKKYNFNGKKYIILTDKKYNFNGKEI